MTVPYERTQAVLRTRDLLRELAAGDHVDPDMLRRRASSLLKHFPASIDIAVSAGALPTVWAALAAKWYE